MTIWKYPVLIENRFTVQMPSNHKVLSVQIQAGEPCMWVMVDEYSESRDVQFRTYGTGHPINLAAEGIGPSDFVGTFQLVSLGLVFHLFEVPAQ